MQVGRRWSNDDVIFEKHDSRIARDQKYKKEFAPANVNIASIWSTSLSYREALKQLIACKSGLNPFVKHLEKVMLVICLHNFDGFCGIRLDSVKSEAHPQEHEILLSEGFQTAVLAIEDIYIDNSMYIDQIWRHFNHNTIKIIYLIHIDIN